MILFFFGREIIFFTIGSCWFRSGSPKSPKQKTQERHGQKSHTVAKNREKSAICVSVFQSLEPWDQMFQPLLNETFFGPIFPVSSGVQDLLGFQSQMVRRSLDRLQSRGISLFWRRVDMNLDQHTNQQEFLQKIFVEKEDQRAASKEVRGEMLAERSNRYTPSR